MNELNDNDQLLTDVLGEGTSPGFREGLLEDTLRRVRRRRRFRHVRQGISVLAVLAVVSLLLVRRPAPVHRGPAEVATRPYTLVRTRPLPPAEQIQTRRFPAASMLASVRTEHVILTAEAGTRVRDLTDDELLALAPKPAALVRFSPHSAELVFVDEADRQESLRN
jgi:hypothetical protein